MIKNLVACEHDYINTDHPDFIGGPGAVKQVMEDLAVRKAAAAAARARVRFFVQGRAH
jgi:dynamin 1-like protein